MIKNEIKQYYDADKTLLNISEKSEFKLLKSYKNKDKKDKNLNFYAIFFPRKKVLCSLKVFKVIGIEKDKTKFGKLELVLDNAKINEEKFVLSSYTKIANQKIKISNYSSKCNKNLFPVEINKTSVIDYFKNIN